MAIYYVKNGGSDAADGLSDGNAWETIAKVNGSSFNAGDSVLFKKGSTWREQLTVPSSGSSGSPITFGAYGAGEMPVISGADIITSWTSQGNNVYSKAGITTEPHIVTYNGTRLNYSATLPAGPYTDILSET